METSREDTDEAHRHSLERLRRALAEGETALAAGRKLRIASKQDLDRLFARLERLRP